jgi:hypothetical protein
VDEQSVIHLRGAEWWMSAQEALCQAIGTIPLRLIHPTPKPEL